MTRRKLGSLVGIAAGALVVIALGSFFATRSRKPASPEEATGDEAVKQGDVLFKQHRYLAAGEMYEKAASSPAPNKKKAAEEARGEEAYNSLRTAIAAGEGDKARNLFERCAAESTWWCQKAQELGDQAKAAYAKTHVTAALASKSAGKLEGCLAEASKVLEFDTANSEAQGLKSQCQQHEVPKAEPARSEAPSPRDREAKAARLAKASYDKLMARDFSGAVKDAQAALTQSPTDKNTLLNAYRSLGYGYAYLNDKPNAVKWLEKYLPFCTNDCDQVHAFIGN